MVVGEETMLGDVDFRGRRAFVRLLIGFFNEWGRTMFMSNII